MQYVNDTVTLHCNTFTLQSHVTAMCAGCYTKHILEAGKKRRL